MRYAAFDFTDEDGRFEEATRSFLAKFSASGNSAAPVSKHKFLQSFSKGAKSLSKKLSNELIDILMLKTQSVAGRGAFGFRAMSRTSKPSFSRNRDRKRQGDGRGNRFSVFDFNDEDDRIEKDSRSLIEKFSASRSPAVPVSKQQFLQCFAKGAKSLSRKLSHEIIDIDAEDCACEVSEISPHHSFPSQVGKGADTDSFSEKVSYEIIHIDSEDWSLEGDGSTKQEIFETNSLLLSPASTKKDVETVIFPDFVIYEGNCCTASKLIFSCSCIKLQGSAVNRLQRTFDSEWAVSDIIGIESEWCKRVETAIVNLRFKGKHFTRAANADGIELLKFSVCDPLWSEREKEIKSLNLRYNDSWNADNDDKVGWEEIVSGRQSDALPLKHCFLEFIEPFEEIIYAKGDPDAIAISKRDLELLKPETFINDTIIDFYIKYLKNKFQLEKNDRFYFFNSFFFRKLVDLDKDLSSACGGSAAFQRVRKWTKKVNLFEKDYIFIPVNYSLHWSLVVICHPGEVGNLKDKTCDNLSKVPCILHMDSIKGSHRGLGNLFQNYLCEEWKERYGVGGDQEDVSAKFLAFRFVPLELPQQENSFDCGLFLLHYVELFLEGALVNFSPFKISKFSNFLSQDWFPPEEASVKRAHILQLVYEIMVSNQEKEFSGSICKYPSSSVGDSEHDLSSQVYLGETHISTMTCPDKFSSCGKEQEKEMFSSLSCSKKRFTEFGSVFKVSSDTNYQRIGGQSRSAMSPIEEDENGEIADSPAISFGQHFGELEISKNNGKRLSPCPSLRESQTVSESGRDRSPQSTERLNHSPTEADEPETLTTSSELFTYVVEDSEEQVVVEDLEDYVVVEDSGEENERNDVIEIESSSTKRDSNLFQSRQVVVESNKNLSNNRKQGLLLSNEHSTYDTWKQQSTKRPRV